MTFSVILRGWWSSSGTAHYNIVKPLCDGGEGCGIAFWMRRVGKVDQALRTRGTGDAYFETSGPFRVFDCGGDGRVGRVLNISVLGFLVRSLTFMMLLFCIRRLLVPFPVVMWEVRILSMSRARRTNTALGGSCDEGILICERGGCSFAGRTVLVEGNEMIIGERGGSGMRRRRSHCRRDLTLLLFLLARGWRCQIV